MNNLRKIAAGSLAAVLAFSMAACGSSNASSDGTGESTGKAVTVNEKSAKATSLADFGTMEDLEKAAKEEGALNVIALPHDWSNYGEVIEGFKKKYPEIKVTELNPKFAEAGAAFNGYLMANQLAGGDINNLQPGLDFFKKLKEAGNLTTVDVTNGTIDSGQTGVVFDWTYNQASYKKELKDKGVNWRYKTFPKAQVVSYYNQAINKDAPHPAAARLWEEYLYTADAQNLWFKGGANPVLLDSMKEGGTIDQATLKDAITIEGEPVSYTNDDSTRITEWLQNNWDKTIGN